jgi:hypothetical protein
MDGLSTAFTAALFSAPVALVIGIVFTFRVSARPFDRPMRGRMPWMSLGVVTLFWISVSIIPQQELRNSANVERLVADGKWREALNYFAKRQPTDFAPARILPPKPYERGLFEQLPMCFEAVQPIDPDWVRLHLVERLDQMVSHYGPRFERRRTLASYQPGEQIEHIADGVRWFGPEASGWIRLLDGLERIPNGQDWINRNAIVFDGLRECIREKTSHQKEATPDEIAKQAEWINLSHRIQPLISTNAELKAEL